MLTTPTHDSGCLFTNEIARNLWHQNTKIAVLIQIQVVWKAWNFPQLRTKSWATKVIWNKDGMVSFVSHCSSISIFPSYTHAREIARLPRCLSSGEYYYRRRGLFILFYIFSEMLSKRNVFEEKREKRDKSFLISYSSHFHIHASSRRRAKLCSRCEMGPIHKLCHIFLKFVLKLWEF